MLEMLMPFRYWLRYSLDWGGRYTKSSSIRQRQSYLRGKKKCRSRKWWLEQEWGPSGARAPLPTFELFVNVSAAAAINKQQRGWHAGSRTPRSSTIVYDSSRNYSIFYVGCTLGFASAKCISDTLTRYWPDRSRFALAPYIAVILGGFRVWNIHSGKV